MKATEDLKKLANWLIDYVARYADGTYCITTNEPTPTSGIDTMDVETFDEVVEHYNNRQEIPE